MTRLLEVDHVSVRFPLRRGWFARGGGAVHAVTDVSMHVDRGEIVGVVGESGSGKTTLGRAVLALQPPSEGVVRFDGHPLGAQSRVQLRRLRRRFQPVFQDPTASLNPALTVSETLGEALMLGGIGDRKDRAARIAGLLDRVGLPGSAATRHPQALSGGQRQRVGIARALAVEPELLIADEAVSALDVSVQAGIVNLLADLRRELGLAILFVSHDLALVGYFCDRVVVLYLGRVMEAGPSAALFAAPRHPYTRALLDAAPMMSRPPGRAPMVLAGELPSPVTPPSGCVFRTRCPYVIPECAAAVPPFREDDLGHGAACIRQDELARDHALA